MSQQTIFQQFESLAFARNSIREISQSRELLNTEGLTFDSDEHSWAFQASVFPDHVLPEPEIFRRLKVVELQSRIELRSIEDADFEELTEPEDDVEEDHPPTQRRGMMISVLDENALPHGLVYELNINNRLCPEEGDPNYHKKMSHRIMTIANEFLCARYADDEIREKFSSGWTIAQVEKDVDRIAKYHPDRQEVLRLVCSHENLSRSFHSLGYSSSQLPALDAEPEHEEFEKFWSFWEDEYRVRRRVVLEAVRNLLVENSLKRIIYDYSKAVGVYELGFESLESEDSALRYEALWKLILRSEWNKQKSGSYSPEDFRKVRGEVVRFFDRLKSWSRMGLNPEDWGNHFR